MTRPLQDWGAGGGDQDKEAPEDCTPTRSCNQRLTGEEKSRGAKKGGEQAVNIQRFRKVFSLFLRLSAQIYHQDEQPKASWTGLQGCCSTEDGLCLTGRTEGKDGGRGQG